MTYANLKYLALPLALIYAPCAQAQISAPTDLANCQLWLDAEDASTLDSSGGLTYTWDDKSGQGNHATCQTAKPFTIHSFSGKRFLMIGGVGSSGAVGGWVSINSVATHLTGNFTIAIVGGGQVDATSGGRYLAGAGRSSSATPLVSLLTASSKWVAHRRNDANTIRTLTSSADASNTPGVHVLIYDGTNLTYRRNGTQLGQGTASGAITLDQFALGLSPRNTNVNPGYAIYGAVVVYSDAKSGTDLTDLESYLTSRHLVTLTGEIANTLPIAFQPMLVRATDNAGVIAHTLAATYADHDDNAATGLYYVDFYNGNDGNSGVLASPLKTMDAALAKTDVVWIKTKTLVTPDGWGAGYTRPNRGCGISVYTGGGLTKGWFAEAETGTWALSSGQTNTYEITRTAATTRVADVTSQDATTGEPLSYTSRASIALVEANPGSYFSDSGTGKVYVHAWDSRAISVSSGIVVQIGTLDMRIPFTGDNRPWVLTNVGFIGRAMATQSWDIATSRHFYNNMESHFTNQFSYTNPERVGYYRTKLTNMTSDGFDYRGDCIGYEVECSADQTAAADANNCTTGHSTAVILSVKGRYSRGSRNVHDIDAVQRQMIDCDSLDAHAGAGGADTDVGYFSGANDGGNDTCGMWLYKCRSSGNVTDLLAEKNCPITCYRMASIRVPNQTVRGTGSITFSNSLRTPGGIIGDQAKHLRRRYPVVAQMLGI